MHKIPANFKLRLLARLTDDAIIFLPYTLIFYMLTYSQNLVELLSAGMLYTITIGIPGFFFIGLFYYSYITSKYGGTPGKILTGLSVTDEQGAKLTMRKSLFRHIIGYQFSSLLFGLGFFSVAKDPQKQGWHDKAVGSKVVVVGKKWQQGLTVCIILTLVHIYLLGNAVSNLATGPLVGEVVKLLN